MASISSTSSLGNTSLRGYGGMASGIDRDAIIEKMTLGTTTKINNQKGKITQLQWKQEAYRNISDQIIDLADKYTSYSSTSSLKDASIFSKSVISVHGKEDSTRFVTATGSSDLVNNVSIKEVSQLATSGVMRSGNHISDAGLQTGIGDLGKDVVTTKLEGTRLTFGRWTENSTDGGKFNATATFTLPTTYKDDKGVTHTIDYTSLGDKTLTPEQRIEKTEALVNQLNEALKYSDIDLGEGKALKDAIEFKADGDKISIIDKGLGDYRISTNSSALEALGFNRENTDSLTNQQKASLSVSEFNTGINKPLAESAVAHQTTLEYLTGKKVTFNYDGSQKEIELITKEEAEKLGKITADTPEAEKKTALETMAANIQNRLNKAFGEAKTTTDDEGKLKVESGVYVDISSGSLSFKTKSDSSVSITSSNSELLKNMGIAYGESNKVNLNGKLDQSALKSALDDSSGKVDFSKYTVDGTEDGELDIVINDVQIKGLTKDSSISDILNKINSSDAGVKATYVNATGQFMLVSSETGANRNITFGISKSGAADSDGLAAKLFDGTFSEGQNAKIKVSYGNGVDVDLERSSNTFNLEGLNVTVSGTFGGSYNDAGAWVSDSSGAVTFTAKADVDAAVERVKSFFEDFNALATDINKEITTRPDSSYGPLTDEQKDEMDETSIKNWEEKAKQGMLYGDSAMRDLSMDVQGILNKLMSNGVSYQDLEKIGITYSDDWGDGGTLVFNESKFRQAMETDPELVSNIFTGGNGVSKGLMDVVDEAFTPYATRYASKNAPDGGKGSYGRLIELAGSDKKPTSLLNNEIYNQIKDLNTLIEQLQDKLKKEQDRYISQFTTMESLINQMNNQSSYLSQITG